MEQQEATQDKEIKKRKSRQRTAALKPGVYYSQYARQAYELCLLGYANDRLAEFFGTSVSVLEQWKDEQPEFAQKLRDGHDLADAAVARTVYEMALGICSKEKKPDMRAATLWLKARQRSKWDTQHAPQEEVKQLPIPFVTVYHSGPPLASREEDIHDRIRIKEKPGADDVQQHFSIPAE